MIPADAYKCVNEIIFKNKIPSIGLLDFSCYNTNYVHNDYDDHSKSKLSFDENFIEFVK